MKILIKVTKEILERSAMCGHTTETRDSKSYNCAVALAAQEIFPGCQVCPWGIHYGGVSMKHDAERFIAVFDLSEPAQRLLLQPQSFEIEVPQEVIEKIGIGEVYRILSESKTLELVHP